jgi:hypothetical protein
MEKTNEMQATAERYSMIIFMLDHAGFNYEFQLLIGDEMVSDGNKAKYLYLRDEFGLDAVIFHWEWNHHEPDPNGEDINWMATVYLDEKTFNKLLIAYNELEAVNVLLLEELRKDGIINGTVVSGGKYIYSKK